MKLRTVLVTALCAVAAFSAGCSSTSSGTPTAASTTAAPVPTGFDPCNIDPNVLAQFQLKGAMPHDSNDGDSHWRGCQYIRSDWYAMDVWMTNVTLADVRARHYQDTQEFQIDGRNAISSRQVPAHPMQQCTVNVEIKDGTLEFFLSNSISNREGGNKNSCDMAKEVADSVVRTLPPTL